MTKVVFTGSRSWNCQGLADVVVGRLARKYGGRQSKDLLVIVGDAAGVDACVRTSCASMGVAFRVFEADWDKLGKRAGPIRNTAMLDQGPDFVIAIHKNIGWSKGTRDCAKQALERRIPVWLVDKWSRKDPMVVNPVRLTQIKDREVYVLEN